MQKKTLRNELIENMCYPNGAHLMTKQRQAKVNIGKHLNSVSSRQIEQLRYNSLKYAELQICFFGRNPAPSTTLVIGD